jgi:cytochrome c oxidase subunit 1
VWSIYATSIIQVLATPVLGLSLVLIAIDHAFGLGIFDPRMGGDPVLFQHLFWFYSHPAVYIMILPAMGVISEVVCTFARKNPLSYAGIAFSSIGIAFVGFLTWGHHMFIAGMSLFDTGLFGVLSMFVGIFSAIKVYNWVGTLYRGHISFRTPLFYFFAFLFLFVFGGMTGIAVATSSLDVHWTDTYFVVAHFHFIMVGGTLTAFLAALHYWFPKMFGRLYSERVGLFCAALVFMGFFLTFMPQFLLGNMGMPRRYYSYPERFQALNVLSTGGAFLLGGGLVLTLAHLLIALRWGTRTPQNPWGSTGFEWLTESPPTKHNFDTPPTIDRGPYDYWRRSD